jgi:hypothetical protein
VVYKEQEELRKRWLEEQGNEVAQARTRMEASVKSAREALAADAAAARASLQDASSVLADQITATVLGGRSA